MKIYIFDIDGTLTSTDTNLIAQSGYPTHAFWDLLTYPFVPSPSELEEEIHAWRETVMQLDEADFITSSTEMLQKSIKYLPRELSEQEIIDRAKQITQDFIRHDVVVKSAIAFLNSKAEEGNICILSTGSYQSGAKGFLAALCDEGLICQAALENIIVSGAVVDWEKKQVEHANVHNNKIKGLNALLSEKYDITLKAFTGYDPANENEVYVYADDPSGNDFGILSLAKPERRYVIPNDKNHEDTPKLEYTVKTWDEIVDEEN